MQPLSAMRGPRGVPLLGNLLDLDVERLHRVLLRWCDEFGPLFRFRIGPRPVVVVADPELMNPILKARPKAFRRLDTIESVFREMGIDGVFSAEGAEWQRQRRMTVHALDSGHLRAFLPTLVRVTERLKRRWERAADRRDVVDIQQDLMRYTVDVTTNLAFGYDMNTLENDGDVIQRHLERILPAINRRINAPFAYWRVVRLPADRAVDRSLAAIRAAIDEFIARARARMAQDPRLATEPSNLLEAMLAARDEGGTAFTDGEVRGNVLTMLLAGEDTTANTLAWTAHFMVLEPDVQQRMRAEADAVVGAAGIVTELQDVARLPYLDAVAHESMRLKPVAPIVFLGTIEDAELGGFAVPKGTSLMLLTMHAGLQERHFADAARFRPERWIEAAAAASAQSPGSSPMPGSSPPAVSTGPAHDAKAFLPFGAGPRFCPGRQLAMVEIKTVLAMLCAAFEVDRAEGTGPVAERFSFTMMPEGLRVRLRRRGERGTAERTPA